MPIITRAAKHSCARIDDDPAMSTIVMTLLYLLGSLTWFALLSAIFWLAVRGGPTGGGNVLKGPRGAAMSSLQVRESMYGSA